LDAFSAILLYWHSKNKRFLPWKKDKNPYFIWLSEIILQQTRIDQGTPYFLKFIEKYPTIKTLANAPDDDVFKLWQGLGYYNRARNLITTARYIDAELNGKFPENYDQLLQLKGIGPYTAAAIASFAFNQPHAVVDGNVIRVITRYMGIESPVDQIGTKQKIDLYADQLLDKSQPGAYNQAIMDFGSTVCTPKKPKCGECPFMSSCKSTNHPMGPEFFPIKTKKPLKKRRFLYYLVFCKGNEVAIRKRTNQEIWPNLYEFYLIESNEKLSHPEKLAANYTILDISKSYKQMLSHQYLELVFIQCSAPENEEELPDNMFFTKNYSKFAFPKTIDAYIKENFKQSAKW
jgi:A/G-specific adenine glycosylase